MELKAVKSRLIIKKQVVEAKTASGIFLGGETDGATVFAEIVSVGPECKEGLKVGDIVLPDWRATVPLKYENQDYMIVDEKGILGVLEQ